MLIHVTFTSYWTQIHVHLYTTFRTFVHYRYLHFSVNPQISARWKGQNHIREERGSMQCTHTQPHWKQETSVTSETRLGCFLIPTHQTRELHENSDTDLQSIGCRVGDLHRVKVKDHVGVCVWVRDDLSVSNLPVLSPPLKRHRSTLELALHPNRMHRHTQN